VVLFFRGQNKMHVGAEIENFRKKYRFAVSWFCKTLDMTESEYRKFIVGRYTPYAYQLVFFLTGFRCPLDSIVGKTFVEGPPKIKHEPIPFCRGRCKSRQPDTSRIAGAVPCTYNARAEPLHDLQSDDIFLE